MSATATSSALDTAITKLKAAANSCGYGLTDRRLKPLRAAMEEHTLCISAFPDIMNLSNKALYNHLTAKGSY